MVPCFVRGPGEADPQVCSAVQKNLSPEGCENPLLQQSSEPKKVQKGLTPQKEGAKVWYSSKVKREEVGRLHDPPNPSRYLPMEHGTIVPCSVMSRLLAGSP